jgi:hypothetical protein
MKTRHGVIRHTVATGAAALLVIAVSLTAGCASSGSGAQSTGSAQNAGEDAQARCRSAIADVTRLCGENADSGRCADAKARSRASCI